MRTENIEFDTHSIIKRLVHTGLKEATAEEIVHALNKSRQFDISNLATRADIALLNQEVGSIKENMATKVDIANIKESMATKADIANIKTDIERTKNEILKWMIPFMLTNTLAVIGVVISLFLKH